VNSKAVGDGQRWLKYLAPYVFRVAISDRRIVAIDHGPDGWGQITFGYRKSGSCRWRRMTVSAEELLQRFLQHVLLPGFGKVRQYGFASAPRRSGYERIRWLVTLAVGLVYLLHAADPKTKPGRVELRCTGRGGPVVFHEFIRPPAGPSVTRPRHELIRHAAVADESRDPQTRLRPNPHTVCAVLRLRRKTTRNDTLRPPCRLKSPSSNPQCQLRSTPGCARIDLR